MPHVATMTQPDRTFLVFWLTHSRGSESRRYSLPFLPSDVTDLCLTAYQGSRGTLSERMLPEKP